MASEEERRILAEKVLAEVGKQSSSIRRQSQELSGFMAVKGARYSGALMVVGRATNGWGDGSVLPKDLISRATVASYSRQVLDSVNPARVDRTCPMSWVSEAWGEKEGYNTKRSAFWRVIKRVVGGLKIADIEVDTWPSHLVWSNLYKVAPAKGGNPGDKLCEIQLCGCRELFELELKTYTPSRLLLLTGWIWASDFLDSLKPTWRDAPEFDYVERHGTLDIAEDQDPIQCVVAKHPQRKPEGPWVDDVCRAFAR